MVAPSSDTVSSLLIPANWPTMPGITAGCTTRLSPEASDFNVALHTGADRVAALANRIKLHELMPGPLNSNASWQWLDQVHGSTVYRSTGNVNEIPQADACITTERGRVCAVLTADCLPILIAAKDGSVVAAVHGGWRSLAGNIIANVFEQLLALTSSGFVAWLGPAISKHYFEVGAEVVDVFISGLDSKDKNQFLAECCSTPESMTASDLEQGKKYLDLYAIARFQCRHLPVKTYGGDYCTYGQSEQFYSYRRAKETGRFCTFIGLHDD